jgi:hypothetical protein
VSRYALRIEQLYYDMEYKHMGMTQAFHPLPLKRRGFHGLKPNFCKTYQRIYIQPQE